MKPVTDKRFIISILGALMTISPFSIDMYLPAFSQIAKDLHSTTSTISLSVASYFVGLAIGQLAYGPLLDRFGRKKPLCFGLCFYILACLGCMLSQTAAMLIVFRFIQALGGCVALVATLAMVRDFFPVNESAKVLSLLMLILGLSPLLAPTAGGFIVTSLGWQWVFIIMAIIVFLILLVIIFLLPEGHTPDHTISLAFKPMLNTFLSVIKNPIFYTYSLSGAFSFATLFTYVVGSPIIFMDMYHVSPKTYGFIFALLSIGFIGSNQVNIFLLKKYKSQHIFRIGLLCQATIVLIFLLGSFNGVFGLTGTVVMFFISLIWLGLTYPNASALAMSPFSKNAGTASALIGFLQIGIAGLTSSCIGIFNATNTAPIIAVMASTAVIALLILAAGSRKISRSVDQ
jgi:DHA1 family bicyclomycin/chloramphenicol resistance-like MFS transporter